MLKETIKYKTLYIQMEYCEGNTLSSIINAETEANLKFDQKLKLISQIVEALAYIHQQTLIHRDIKPSNIFLDINCNIKLGDFGLAVKNKFVETKEREV